MKRVDPCAGRVPEGGGWEGRARCGAPRTFHNVLVRAARHCPRAQCVCGEEAQGRARPGCQLRQGKGPPTDPPGLLHIQKAERGEREKMQPGQLSSPIMHSSHNSGPFFSTNIGTPEDLI